MLVFLDFGGGALTTQQRVGAPRRWLRGAGRTQGYTVGAWKRDRPLAIRQGVLAKSAILTFFGFARTGIELGKAPQAVDCAIRCAHVSAFRKSWGWGGFDLIPALARSILADMPENARKKRANVATPTPPPSEKRRRIARTLGSGEHQMIIHCYRTTEQERRRQDSITWPRCSGLAALPWRE